MVNGQCLYATRRAHFGGMHFLEISTPFARSERNVKLHAKPMYIFFFTADGISFFFWGGVGFPLAMVPSLCIDKKVGFDSPRCAVSFPKIGIGQMDSKQEFFAPSDVQVNLQCAMLISTAGYTHSMTKVAVQLFVRR